MQATYRGGIDRKREPERGGEGKVEREREKPEERGRLAGQENGEEEERRRGSCIFAQIHTS